MIKGTMNKQSKQFITEVGKTLVNLLLLKLKVP